MSQIKDKVTGNVFDTPYSFQGGIIQFLPSDPDCPVLIMPSVVMPGLAEDGGDAVRIFPGRDMSNRFVKWVEGEDPDPDPDPDPEPPLAVCGEVAAPKPLENPVKVRAEDGNVIFFIKINNHVGYRVQFSTTFYGAFDVNNQPTAWQEIAPLADGSYPVMALAVENPSINLTEVRARWVGCTATDWGVYVGLSPQGTVNPPVGNGNAISRAKPIFLSVWGNGGAISDDPNVVPQGTDREEGYMMTNWPATRPFFTQNNVRNVIVDRWFKNQQGQNTTNYEKISVTSTVRHFITTEVNTQLNEYAVRSGVQGFNFLWYADDSPLNRHRLEFKANAKRGLKCFYSLENMGGGYENFGGNNAYTRSVNTIAEDMTQSWYYKHEGKPVLGQVIFDSKIDVPGEIAKEITTRNRILDRYRQLTGNNSDQFFKFMFTDNVYDRGNWYQSPDAGFDCIGAYYLFGDFPNNDFNVVVQVTNSYMASRTNTNLVPTIMTGFDNRPREWFYSGGTDPGGSFYTEASTYANFPTLLNNVVNALDNNPNWPFGMVNVIDEHTEQVICWTPRLRSDGSIDASIVEMMRQRLNPGYGA